MTTKTILERLKAKKVNKTSLVYQLLTQFCKDFDEGKYNVIHTCKVYGSYNHTSINDKGYEMTLLLNKLRIKYEVGNDAPRGGRHGNYVRILNMKK